MSRSTMTLFLIALTIPIASRAVCADVQISSHAIVPSSPVNLDDPELMHALTLRGLIGDMPLSEVPEPADIEVDE